MRGTQLVLRGLTFYWRTHLAVVLGVATAVAVLSGALLVGDSVRGSLRDLVVARLGRTDLLVASAGLFRDDLGAEIRSDTRFTSSFGDLAPLFIARGIVTQQDSGRRVGQVAVYGVDDRFWKFHSVEGVSGPSDREALISPALAEQLGAAKGASVLVRLQRPTDVPIETLQGRKDDLGRTLRLTVAGVLPGSSLGEFSLEPQQADVRAVFVPLSRLQQELETPGRVNTLLVSARPGRANAVAQLRSLVTAHTMLDDLGLTIKALEARNTFVLGSAAGLIDDRQAAAAQKALAESALQARPILTYLANTMRVGDREVPYSLVTALDLTTIPVTGSSRTVTNGTNAPSGPSGPSDPIVLNSWAAAELGARQGDPLTMEYYVWEEPGRLVTRTATFRVAGIVPVEAGDRDLTPTLEGVSDSPTLQEWDPPFPVDLRRIRPTDEEYWRRYKTTPKAFVPLEAGQRLWRSRYGAMTSLRITPQSGTNLEDARKAYAQRLRAAVDPMTLGFAVTDVRAESLSASRGATDFGEYLVYSVFFSSSLRCCLRRFFSSSASSSAPAKWAYCARWDLGPARFGSCF